MEKTVGALDARRQLGKILKEVSGNGEHYVVEYHGEPVAAVIPIELYRQWQRRREAFFETMRKTAEQAQMPEDEAIDLVQEAIQMVRAQR